jgi:hypothetical protein
VPMFKADDRRGDRKGHPDRHVSTHRAHFRMR